MGWTFYPESAFLQLPDYSETIWLQMLAGETDDASPDDVLAKGHINNVVRRAIACGVDPIEAFRMATINTALHFGLKNKGAVAPGRDADLVVLDDLENVSVKSVWVAGKQIAEHGRMFTDEPDSHTLAATGNTVRVAHLDKTSFDIVTHSGLARVIGLNEGDLVTESLVLPVKTDSADHYAAELNPELLKVAVIERHHATGHVGLGLVKGFVEEGKRFNSAIASTIAHDSHNIVVAGDNDDDMLAAVEALKAMQGGIVLVREGKVVESLRLEVGGLMTQKPAAVTAERKKQLIRTAHEKFHVACGMHPVMTLSFLPLAVIPHLRVTDLGLFDVNQLTHVEIDPEEN